ncbi:LysM peptidoglycan-binding domain-containing protein [Vagococcus coleopterorum]|uniref:LysM peptidoglycan-binding domain-containing protein n=1 Tax=Vagococcus coleopterorum TaxID=2714946 RepID=A0A6G8ANV5_9ENTE|nr:SAG1386/EF1546 family surface-associated protein [Vagococcus coleopterorum]QIL46603.1 LysM peptidoglycan-binding domain-containing protein [Vagococcus coleopterorum]
MTDKKEPWEQPIYDENNETAVPASRSEQRSKKKGDSAFITILVLLLLAIAALLIFMFNQGKKPLEEKTSPIEITETTAKKEDEDKAAKEKAEKEKAEKEKAETEKTEAETKPETEKPTEDKKEDEKPAEETYTIQPGDQFDTVGPAFGLTADELLALNPDVDPTGLQIGQVIRVK